MQQNRIKTLLHRNTNDRRCSNIPRSSPPIACPTRSETEEHSHWLGRGTPPQSGLVHHVMRVHFGVLNHLIRCRQLDCSACLTRWSFHVEVVSNARHRHIPYERPARESVSTHLGVFRQNYTYARWFLKNRGAGWGKRFCYDVTEMIQFCLVLAYNQDCGGQMSRLVN